MTKSIVLDFSWLLDLSPKTMFSRVKFISSSMKSSQSLMEKTVSEGGETFSSAALAIGKRIGSLQGLHSTLVFYTQNKVYCSENDNTQYAQDLAGRQAYLVLLHFKVRHPRWHQDLETVRALTRIEEMACQIVGLSQISQVCCFWAVCRTKDIKDWVYTYIYCYCLYIYIYMLKCMVAQILVIHGNDHHPCFSLSIFMW